VQAGRRALAAIPGLLVLAACKPPEEASVKAIVGGVLIDGSGGPPVSNSVILIAGSRIAAAGPRISIAIPQGADEINGAGKFIVPAMLDVYAGATSGARPDPGVTAVSVPDFAPVATLADARRLVDEGIAGFVGMIRDTEEIDPAFIARLRNLRIIFAPALSGLTGAPLEIAKSNTRRLAAGGVLIAASSGAAPIAREMELLVEAGLTPGDAIVAATRNGAQALRKSGELGTIQPGRNADLQMLGANPIEDIRNLRSIERVMMRGAWVKGIP
jgi:imidazolonepropionase-like amidohydrolase